jgi:hypothetical protein
LEVFAEAYEKAYCGNVIFGVSGAFQFKGIRHFGAPFVYVRTLRSYGFLQYVAHLLLWVSQEFGSLSPVGFLTLHGTLSRGGFLLDHGTLRPPGFLSINGTLCFCGFLTLHGTLLRLGFLSKSGTLSLLGLLSPLARSVSMERFMF